MCQYAHESPRVSKWNWVYSNVLESWVSPMGHTLWRSHEWPYSLQSMFAWMQGLDNQVKMCLPPTPTRFAPLRWFWWGPIANGISPHPLKGMFILEPPHPQCVTLHKHHEAQTTHHVFDPPTQSIRTLPMLKTMSVNSIARCSKVLGHLVCETLFVWCEVVGVIHRIVKRVEGKKLLWECG